MGGDSPEEDGAPPDTVSRFLETRVDVGEDGLTLTVNRRNLELEDDFIDPCFFDDGYSVAAATAFSRVWEGGMVLIDLLKGQLKGVVAGGAPVVELGAGTGLAGLCAAALGAHVLLTDVRSVVEEPDVGLLSNIARNASEGPAGGEGGGVEGSPWPGPVAVGRGSAAAVPLDWERPEDAHQGAGCSVVLAAECVWLKDLVEPFVATVCALLRGPGRPTCYMSSVDRSKEGSQAFASLQEVIDRYEEEGCAVELVHRRPSLEDPIKETCVWAISAP